MTNIAKQDLTTTRPESASKIAEVLNKSKDKKKTEKADGFNVWQFLVQFGLDNIKMNIEGMNVGAAQMKVQEKNLTTANDAYNKLINTTIPNQTSLTGFGKFCGWFTGGQYAAGTKKSDETLKKNALDGYKSDPFGSWIVNSTPNSEQMAVDQGKQAQLNTVTTQSNNRLSTTEKMTVENGSSQNTQISQMISSEIQNMSNMMQVRVNG